MKVWTLEYVPFVMGGSVWQPIYCDIEIQGTYDLGKGYKGHLVVAPNGKTFVAESETGAFVGPTIDAVRKDIKKATKKVMKQQIEDAKVQVKNAKEVKPEEFWRKLSGLS